MRNSCFSVLIVASIFAGCGRVSPTARTMSQVGFSPTNVTSATIVSTSDVTGAEARQVSSVNLAALWQCIATAEPVSENHFLVASKYRITLRTNAAGVGDVVNIFVDSDGGACLEGSPLARKHFFRSTELYDWVIQSRR